MEMQIFLRGVESAVMGECLASESAMPVLRDGAQTRSTCCVRELRQNWAMFIMEDPTNVVPRQASWLITALLRTRSLPAEAPTFAECDKSLQHRSRGNDRELFNRHSEHRCTIYSEHACCREQGSRCPPPTVQQRTTYIVGGAQAPEANTTC